MLFKHKILKVEEESKFHISYKDRLIYTSIINTTVLVLCHSDMFQPSKGHSRVQ